MLTASRRNDVDMLRGFATLAVIILHALVLSPDLDAYPQLIPLTQRLSTGVQLFFVLSGYLVAQSMDRCMETGEGARGFLIRRAAKLIPLYIVFLHINIALFIAIRSFAPDAPSIRNSLTEATFNLENYFVHLLLLQGLIPDKLHTMLDGSWSIVIEAYFYIFFAFWGYYKSLDLKKSVWLYSMLLIASIMFFFLVGRDHSGYSHYGFPFQFPCLALGVIAYRITSDVRTQCLVASLQKAIAVLSIIFMVGLIKGESKPLGDFNVYALCFAALLISVPVIYGSLNDKVRHVIAIFGRQSYSLFFIHLILLKILCTLDKMLSFNLSSAASITVYLVVAIFPSLLLSSMLFNPIDRYFVNRAHTWLKNSGRSH